jgi:hypothetical protein
VTHLDVPFCTASRTCNPGTISPAANGWIWNLLSVASPTALAINSAAPCSVSSDFGQLVVMRHLISGIDWAIAGAAMVAAPATPNPVTLIKSRRFIELFLLWGCRPAFVSRLIHSMEHPVPELHGELDIATHKAGLPRRSGLRSTT